MTVPFTPDVVSLSTVASSIVKRDAKQLPADVLELLYRQMRVLAGARPDLDDLVQSAAIRLLRALPRFEGRSSLSTFAYGVAYRTLQGHDRWYKRWSRRFTLAEDVPTLEAASSGETSEQTMARARRSVSLHRALAALTPNKRAVIVLHDLEEIEMKEVAAIVGTNERTVRSRLRDGRRQLAVILQKDRFFDRKAP